jgi:hypothetical protein
MNVLELTKNPSKQTQIALNRSRLRVSTIFSEKMML